MTKRIEVDKRAALSRIVRDARARRGWNRERTAERATDRLREAADLELGVTACERELWASIEVTRHHVAGLEDCPASPLGSEERRAILLGVVLALEMDRAMVNRHAGGI